MRTGEAIPRFAVNRRLLTPSGNSPPIAGTSRKSNHCKLERQTASSNRTSRHERSAAPIVAATVSRKRTAAWGAVQSRPSMRASSSRDTCAPASTVDKQRCKECGARWWVALLPRKGVQTHSRRRRLALHPCIRRDKIKMVSRVCPPNWIAKRHWTTSPAA